MNAAQYIGLPFKDGGRGPDYDCWGLVCKVYSEQLNIELPTCTGEYVNVDDHGSIADLFETHHTQWRMVPESEVVPGDVIVLRIYNLPIHFGVVTGRFSFLHCFVNINTVMEKWNAPRWRNRIVGFWRHKDMHNARVQRSSAAQHTDQ